MSIRDFSIRPCSACKKDTRHFVNKCTDCGNVQLTGAGARRIAAKRHFARMTAGLVDLKSYRAGKRLIKENKQQETAATPSAAFPVSSSAIFGTGREKKT